MRNVHSCDTSGPLTFVVLGVLAVAAVGCMLQARQIAEYEAEARGTWRESPADPYLRELPVILQRASDARIQRAEEVRSYCVVVCGAAGFAVVVLMYLWHSMVFLLTVSDAGMAVAKGKPPRGFVEEADALCAEMGVRQGAIWGVRERQWVHLRFSMGLPKTVQQRLRNVWTNSSVGIGAVAKP